MLRLNVVRPTPVMYALLSFGLLLIAGSAMVVGPGLVARVHARIRPGWFEGLDLSQDVSLGGEEGLLAWRSIPTSQPMATCTCVTRRWTGPFKSSATRLLRISRTWPIARVRARCWWCPRRAST